MVVMYLSTDLSADAFVLTGAENNHTKLARSVLKVNSIVLHVWRMYCKCGGWTAGVEDVLHVWRMYCMCGDK